MIKLNTIKAENAAIATFSHPKFKNRWLSCNDFSRHNRFLIMFKTAIANKMEETYIKSSTDSESTELSEQSNEKFHDFFNFDSLVSIDNSTEQSRRSATSETEIQVR